MIVELYFEISTDEFEKTLALCNDLGAEVITAAKNGSPNGFHEFRIKMACDTFEDYNSLTQVMLYYLDDPPSKHSEVPTLHESTHPVHSAV